MSPIITSEYFDERAAYDVVEPYTTPHLDSAHNDFLLGQNWPAFHPGAHDFSTFAWGNIDDLTAGYPLVSKYSAAGNQREWTLHYEPSSGGWKFTASNDGLNDFGPAAIPPGGVVAGTWYGVFGGYDTVNLYTSFNAGARVGINPGWPSIFAGTAPVTIGRSINTVPTVYLKGRSYCVGVWSRLLSTSEEAFLFDAGVALLFRDLPASIKVGLVAYYNQTWQPGLTYPDANGLYDLVASRILPVGDAPPTFPGTV